MTAPRRRRLLPDADLGESTVLGDLMRSETAGGAMALLAAVVALTWANLDPGSYEGLRHWRLGPLDLEHWAADGALTVFFFVAGLELKRELLVGSLRRPADAAVPVFAACCGVAVPAVLFLVVNRGTDNQVGWAVPAATDVAFALAILAVVGSGLPSQLRAFLLTLAVVDDLIVIVVIAVFYTDGVRFSSLGAAAALFAAYFVLQRMRVRSTVLYVPLALAAWTAMLDSGVHATIAGVALGLLTRVLPDPAEARSPAVRLEHRLVPVSAGVAVPFFALLSAGVSLDGGLQLLGEVLGEPIGLGTVLGLFLGKPVGVLGGAWLLTRLTGATVDGGLEWRDLAGVGLVAGVGFTVSLLVSELAFTGLEREQAKTAVLLGSTLAAAGAAIVLGGRSRHHRRLART